ncbi:MAG: site-specific DNA-methyltransferase [Candidatus Desulfofervidus auxilii]|nr:site-specific DNA-methyltransferase [Candidatus Desulfofervidus auxilii]
MNEIEGRNIKIEANTDNMELKTKERKIFFETKEGNIKIIHDDFLTTNLIKKNSIDLIITSPPYNVDIHYNSFQDDIPYEKYLEFTEKWLKKAFTLTKTDGRICLNIPLDKSKGRKGAGFQTVYADIVNIAKKVGWKYFSTIIWNEGNISRRTAWGSWLSARAPYVIAPVEVIIIFYKEKWQKIRNGKSDITRNEFMEWTNGLWTFSGESKKKVGHPAPFPVELPKRCIKLFSFVGDTVLDPFLGSGSTLIACALLNRKGIGVEIDKNYCKLAKNRLIKEANIYQKKLWSD